MKSYKQLLEELSDKQKGIVDKWSKPGEEREADKISAHVFPKGQDRMTIPLESSHNEVEPHPHVENALQKHNYKVKDYKAGLATDTYGRDVKIGKVLTKHKEEHAAKIFTNDTRRASKHKDLQVVISKHPHDVAGMSTDRGWTSCMNMVGGEFAKHLKDDVQTGTHVAYLTHKGDHEAKDPIARIAMKPYHSYDGSHTILRPERRTYGTATPAFDHTVNKFSEKHYPMKDTEVKYDKENKVYNDDGDSHKINYDHPALVQNIHRDYHGEIAGNTTKKEHLDHLVNSGNVWARSQVADHGHMEHLNKLVKDPDERVRLAVAQKGHKEHLGKLVNDPDHNIRSTVASFGHKEHLDKLVNDPHPDVRAKVARKGFKEHLDKLVNDEEPHVRKFVAYNGQREHINKLIHDPNEIVRHHAMRRDEELYNEENPLPSKESDNDKLYKELKA